MGQSDNSIRPRVACGVVPCCSQTSQDHTDKHTTGGESPEARHGAWPAGGLAMINGSIRVEGDQSHNYALVSLSGGTTDQAG